MREQKLNHEMELELPEYIRRLTDSYDLRVYWWDAVECFRKAAILGLPTLLEPGTTQLSLGICLSILFIVITAWQRP